MTTHQPIRTGAPPRPLDVTTVRVSAGAGLDLLLHAVEQLLLALAATEPCPRARDTGIGGLPLPLGGRVALAAFYRVWDGVDHQAHPSGRPPGRPDDATSTSYLLRLPAADLTILRTAAAALKRPTAELAWLLSRTDSTGRAVRALTALSWTLDPLDETSLTSRRSPPPDLHQPRTGPAAGGR